MDQHGNEVAREGLDLCECGCKYWEHDHCVDCGAHVKDVRAAEDAEREAEAAFIRRYGPGVL